MMMLTMKLNDSRRKPGAIIEAESLRKPAIDKTNLTSGCSFRRFVMPGKRVHITRCAPRKPRTVPQISRNTISHRLNRLWQISVPQGQNGGHHCHKGDLAPSPAIIQSNRAKIPTNAPMSQAGRSASRVCPDEAATTDGTLTANAITAMRKQSQPDSLRDGRSVGITVIIQRPVVYRCQRSDRQSQPKPFITNRHLGDSTIAGSYIARVSAAVNLPSRQRRRERLRLLEPAAHHASVTPKSQAVGCVSKE